MQKECPQSKMTGFTEFNLSKQIEHTNPSITGAVYIVPEKVSFATVLVPLRICVPFIGPW